MIVDAERCYRAVRSRDARFDGWFVVGVTSTGIYCRPSCPATPPKRDHVRFYPTAATAQQAGFRACKRCRPDATPGSPEWSTRSDLVARAVRLIADGTVEREGVPGVARRLHVSERHLHRLVTAELGAGPLALARAQRAQTARTLIETTDLPFAHVAFAAGFASIRQFNDTVREVFASTPTQLRDAARRRRGSMPATASGTLGLRLPYRAPADIAASLGFLGRRAVPGIEAWDGTTYRRTLRLPNGPGEVGLTEADGHVACQLRLHDLRDLQTAVRRCRQLLDLDADPGAVAEHLAGDELLGAAVQARPGVRIVGHPDPAELAVRAVLGQQVSLQAAATLAARLVEQLGDPLPAPDGPLTHLFPLPGAIAQARPDRLSMPAARARALQALAAALDEGSLVLDPGADRADVEARLLVLPGVGAWTASYVALRALGDPDVFLPGDLGVRQGLSRLGVPASAGQAARLAVRWRPWRSYAVFHLWRVPG